MENFKINLNQNLWVLIVALLTLGCSEYFKLKMLYYFGFWLSIPASISIILSLFYYTKNYIQNKSTDNK
jgi:hypothetical protein